MGEERVFGDSARFPTNKMSRRSIGGALAAAGTILLLSRGATASPVSGGVADTRLQQVSQAQKSAYRGQSNMQAKPVVRISISTCDATQIEKLRKMMLESEALLRPGIEEMVGFIDFYSGDDAENNTLTNISLWDTVAHAKQLDTFQPMLDAGKRFVAAGAIFYRPIINAPTMWRFGPVSR